MANIYVDNAGSNTSPYDTWAKAATTLAAAAAIDAAGDTIWVKSTHSESTASAVSLSWAGTAAQPTRIICVSDTGEPPTTIATGAVVATTGSGSNLTVVGAGYAYIYGIRFKAGNASVAADVNMHFAANAYCVFESCAFELGGNNTGSDFNLTNGDGSEAVFVDCTFKGVNTGSVLTFGGSSPCYVIGCSIEAGGTPGNPFFQPSAGTRPTVRGFDFTNLAAGSSLCNTTNGAVTMRVLNCKMPASWTGSINNSTPGSGAEYFLMNCDSADTNYRLEKKTHFGTVTHDTSIYATSGASDGTTRISWKMVSNADTEWLHQTLDSPEIVKWNETTGSSVTVTVEFLIDSATTLNNNDVWMEVMYLGTSGVPLGTIDIDSRAANYLTTAVECTTGTGVANWTGEGGSAKSYKCTSTFTPQEKGFIHATIKLAKASTTIYVDPLMTLS